MALGVLLPLILLLGLHVLTQRYDTVLPPDVLQLTEAQQFESDFWQPQLPLMSEAQAVQMPLVRPSWQPESWLVFDFQLNKPASEPWMLALQHRPGLNVYLDGELLVRSQYGVDADMPERGLTLGSRTLMVNIPPALLHSGGHRISLQLAQTQASSGLLSALQLGPVAEVRELQQANLLWQGLRKLTALAAAMLGGFLLLVWLALRQEWVYGVTGVFTLLLALLLQPYSSVVGWISPMHWRMVLESVDMLTKAMLLGLVAQLMQFERRWPWVLALAIMVLDLAIDLFVGNANWLRSSFSNPWAWWELLSRVVLLGCCWGLALYAATRQVRPVQMAAVVVLGLALGCWAYVSYFSLRSIPVVDLNVVAYASLVGLAAFSLQQRFVRSLRGQARARENLQAALSARTAELEIRYAELQRSEQLRVAAQERHRLLQEMHDGLGSQLLMAKLGVRQGMDRDSLAALLDDCIAEMRLTIDAMTVEDGDLGLLLANVRHRLHGRLQSAGLQVEWQLQDTPRLPRLAGAQGRDLVRIVQETLSNVLHHAGAQRVRFATRVVDEGEAVLLSISDDGRGLPEHPREGQGLRGMRKRAERIGAQIRWRAVDPGALRPGCELLLRIPVAPSLEKPL